MVNHYDVAVVGGGIVGLAHAWMAARRRLRVLLVERTAAAEGASIRNFGMIWPIGQPAGELHQVALRSRELWLELGEQGVLPVEPCGSIHLAHHADELAVLEQFCASNTHPVRMLTATEIVERTPLANPHGLLGGMASDTELRANPRVASARIAAWLQESFGVTCQFNTTIVSVADREVVASDGRRWQAERVVVCSGSDLRTLYPEILAQSGLKLCKLQMLKSVAQINASHTHSTSGSPHLASGLTLRHYSSFRHCPALEAYERRIATDHPELNRYGIHLMASQLPSGEVILGDSHEYDDAIQPFDKPEIDALMLREARKVFQLQDWIIDERWHGVYAKHPTLPIVEVDAEDRVHISVGPGGAGMTMSFGLAERMWRQWMGESE